MKIFDCFTYFDEDLILDLRFNIHNNYVEKFIIIECGEVAEWLKAHAWKVCKMLKVSRVRIPFSPPFFINITIIPS